MRYRNEITEVFVVVKMQRVLSHEAVHYCTCSSLPQFSFYPQVNDVGETHSLVPGTIRGFNSLEKHIHVQDNTAL
jgi:hypothetical protein